MQLRAQAKLTDPWSDFVNTCKCQVMGCKRRTWGVVTVSAIVLIEGFPLVP